MRKIEWIEAKYRVEGGDRYRRWRRKIQWKEGKIDGREVKNIGQGGGRGRRTIEGRGRDSETGGNNER